MAEGPSSTRTVASGFSVSLRDLMPVEPWIRNADDRFRIEAEAREIVGSTLAGVSYLQGVGWNWEPSAADSFDSAFSGVEFSTADHGPFSAVWRNQGLTHALSFGRGSGESRQQMYPLIATPITHSRHWERFVGRRVTDVDLGWHIALETAEARAMESVLAVCLHFGDSGTVFVGLGAVDHAAGRLAYLPDEVIVIFDVDVARDYVSRLHWQTHSPFPETLTS